MSQYLFNLFGYQSSETNKSPNHTARGLPSSWYRSEAMYQLERRAIFSKKWLLISHTNRFTDPGQFVQFHEAGFRFFIVKDRSGKLNAFHNVCRHRAFPVVTEPHGQAKILACKYHGWSYGLNGRLAKAPGYDEMENFNANENNLLPLNIHVDLKGFIWVNMDISKEVSWEEEFAGIDEQDRFESFNFDEFRFDHAWEMQGDYNWKTLADNYNECYHCPTNHPDAGAVSDLKEYSVVTKGGYIKHFASPKPDTDSGLKICSTFHYPNACMTVSPHFFYMMRCVPVSANRCAMEYEVYRHKDASDEAFEKIDSMFKRILNEDKWLCNNAQQNLEAGVYVSGELHSRMEKGPLFFQDTVRNHIKQHHERENKLGVEIWPARQRLPNSACGVNTDDLFCAGLARRDTGMEW